MNTIAEQLKQARLAAKLTQEEASIRAGVSRITIIRLENGLGDIKLSTLQVLVREYGLSLMLLPTSLEEPIQHFIRSGGKLVGQHIGINAPLSIIDTLVDK